MFHNVFSFHIVICVFYYLHCMHFYMQPPVCTWCDGKNELHMYIIVYEYIKTLLAFMFCLKVL